MIRSRHPRLRFVLVALAAVLGLPGCDGGSGPASTDTTSAPLAGLAEKVEFLEQCVSFRRGYESLDFSIRFTNNAGGFLSVPAPSEWDVRLAARVPEDELDDWIPAGVAAGPPPDLSAWTAAGPKAGGGAGPAAGSPIRWLDVVPTTLPLAGVDEWYEDGGRVVGLDRDERVVVYRSFTR